MDEFKLAAAKHKCQKDHLFFTRFFFKQRQGSKFLVNWHHEYMADELEKIITGETENLVINVPPGSSKTEMFVINFISRGLAINHRSRFLHLSYSDDLAILNSQNAREIVTSDEYQALWPLKLKSDTKAKKRWNVVGDDEKLAGGVYATSLSGQVTGFRAGHMAPGFNGAIIIDDPVKPDDAYSKPKMSAANRKLLTTIKSRRANPKTPIVMIMQRVSDTDPTQFILDGGLQGKWKHVVIPAIMTDEFVQKRIPRKYWDKIDSSERDEQGRFSYWEYKEPIVDLCEMESGRGVDREGNSISRHVISSQYQQEPRAIGGNIFKSSMFQKYSIVPKMNYRMIYADTAQKTGERNDFSVFQCWGSGSDGKIYLLDQIRGKWEAQELLKRARAFWAKHANIENEEFGALRKIKPEDKSSGTGLIQQLRAGEPSQKIRPIPVEGIERTKDKLTRAMDGIPYIEMGLVCIPESAPWVNDYISEFESFTADDSHANDDQIDPTLDAINDMLSSNSKLKLWEALADG